MAKKMTNREKQEILDTTMIDINYATEALGRAAKKLQDAGLGEDSDWLIERMIDIIGFQNKYMSWKVTYKHRP